MAQNISFKQYINHFKKVSLPFTITQEKVETISGNPESYMNDSIASKFLGLDLKTLTTKEGPIYICRYYVCPIKNDNVIAVVYLKTVPVQGELYFLEMALYNTKTKKLIDKMYLSTYNLNPDKQMVTNADGSEGFSEEGIVEFDQVEIDKKHIKTITGVFEATLSGFKTVSGYKKEESE